MSSPESLPAPPIATSQQDVDTYVRALITTVRRRLDAISEEVESFVLDVGDGNATGPDDTRMSALEIHATDYHDLYRSLAKAKSDIDSLIEQTGKDAGICFGEDRPIGSMTLDEMCAALVAASKEYFRLQRHRCALRRAIAKHLGYVDMEPPMEFTTVINGNPTKGTVYNTSVFAQVRVDSYDRQYEDKSLMKWTPNREAIYHRLKAGETIEGASLAHPAPFVTFEGQQNFGEGNQ